MAWAAISVGTTALALTLGAVACRTSGTDVVVPPPNIDPPADEEPNLHPVDEVPHWEPAPALLHPVTNNAVAGLDTEAGPRLLSMLGLHAGKRHADITAEVFVLDPTSARWAALPPPPASPGRLAATAQAVAGRVFLFGGYTVAPDGHEVSLARVDVLDPLRGRWSAAAPMPVPVDDAVSGVWRDRYVLLVSGWSDRDNVAHVQVYDTTTDRWSMATPIPGAPVFGHAGGLVGDVIVYCDGVGVHAEAPKFRAESACFRGRLLDGDAGIEVTWASLPPHPGAARYRMASGPIAGRDWVVFAGGTARPYNYDGIGYDGVPAEPETDVFAWDLKSGGWTPLPPLPEARMDHRGLVWLDHTLWLVGGLDADRAVSPSAWRLRL